MVTIYCKGQKLWRKLISRRFSPKILFKWSMNLVSVHSQFFYVSYCNNLMTNTTLYFPYSKLHSKRRICNLYSKRNISKFTILMAWMRGPYVWMSSALSRSDCSNPSRTGPKNAEKTVATSQPHSITPINEKSSCQKASFTGFLLFRLPRLWVRIPSWEIFDF